jgi:hypothetical protein
MDATVGIITGLAASFLVVFVGAIAVQSDIIARMTTGGPLYWWLLLNTAIMVGQFVFTYQIVNQLTQTPKQKENATVA